jgi:hypothetical protein
MEIGMKRIAALLMFACSTRLFAAGAVVGEAGSCMIEIGIYTAHFTIYQSDTRSNQEFCEDLPDTGNTLFVMDYLHGSLSEVPVDFRIIRDLDGLGIFARWDNVSAITDIDARTVFYQPPLIAAENRLSVEHNFLEAGDYIGVVSAPHPDKPIVYHAVFPFKVGRVNWEPWLLLVALLVGAATYIWRRRLHA